MRYDVIVIGGGAAGLMCALTAGQRGRRVALIEHNERVGLKIGISGGAPCGCIAQTRRVSLFQRPAVHRGVFDEHSALASSPRWRRLNG